jgi:hypothetical protein
MLRKSWRYIAVLLALGLLTSLTVGGALAAQPGKGKGQGQSKGPLNRVKVTHVNGTVQGAASATSITVVPKARGKSGKSTDAVTFVVMPDTKIVGEGIAEGTTPNLAQVAPDKARVNVVGRMGTEGTNKDKPVARVIVILGPEDADEDAK